MTSTFLSRIALLVAILVASVTLAAEVKLRGVCDARRAVVRLGDVAEINDVGDEALQRQLIQLPLFPAPQVGLTRRVTSQDVRETMSLYGIALPAVRITGEARVTGVEMTAAVETYVSPASATSEIDSASVETRLIEALTNFLSAKDRLQTKWTITLVASPEQMKSLEAIQRFDIVGGQAPWTGRQAFTIRDANDTAAKAVFLKADVVRTAKAVVAMRAMAVGEVVNVSDVELADVQPQAITNQSIRTSDEVVGQEVLKAIPAGQVIQSTAIRKPMLVRRGELVTVYSLAAGIQVKASAKSLGEAPLGDLLLLESLETGKKIQARVTGPQEAMVFVDTPKVAAAPKKTASADAVQTSATRK